ncbi:MAG TPA: hypothetical protein QGF58_14210 [Myxococcota bacterium]|nr:hypothetical protein [Myxococcota bacterium]
MILLLPMACTGDEPPGNQPPTVTSVTLSPAEVHEGDSITSQVTWDDPEGDDVRLTYSWLVNGGMIQEGAGTVLTSDAFGSGDEIVLAVWGNDGEQDGPTTVSEPLTVLNSPPYVTSVTIMPADPTSSDTLTVEVEGADDIDGDDITLAIAWYIGNSEAATGEELGADLIWRGAEVYASVTPSDGSEEGEPLDSDKLTIANSPPVITEVTIGPEGAGSNDTLSATATAEDADGDSIIMRYDWYVDGDQVGGETGTELDSAHFERDQVVYVIAAGNDGTSQGEGEKSAEITIVNGAPSAPVVEISPAEVGPDNDLSCAIADGGESVDPDDDEEITYSFEWTVDGSSYSDATETDWPGDTVSSDDTTVEDVWVCYGYGSDGSRVSDPGTDEITVVPVYTIDRSDLTGMNAHCSTTAYKSMYNGCAGNDVGFTWTDGESTAPSSVVIEVNHGIGCSTMDYTLYLNGNELTDTWALVYSCQCDPTEAEWSTTLTAAEITDYYTVGGENEFIIEGDNCEGLTQNPAWDDAYARVLVAY